MQKLLFIALIIFTLSGCSHHYHALNASKKVKLVSELVSRDPQCNIYREKLNSPTLQDDDIDTVFNDAMKAHCINKDV